MSITLTRRGFLIGAGCLAGGIAGGCGLRQPARPTRTYLLQAPRPDAKADGEPAGVLVVRPFKVAPAFDSRAFVLRLGESEYATDAYHSFLMSPGPMLTEALADWIRSLGIFATVTTGGSQMAATHALEGEVVELQGDYRVAERPEAVIGLRFRFLHPLSGPGSTVQSQWEERRTGNLPRADADELVAGWNRALAEICRSLDVARFRRPTVESRS